jgi:hypothetical protein
MLQLTRPLYTESVCVREREREREREVYIIHVELYKMAGVAGTAS